MVGDLASALGLSSVGDFLSAGGYSASVLQIIGADIILAGDNAVVIALACRTLPENQRLKGIALGAAAAVVLRIFFTLIVSTLLGIPLLGMIGGLLLFWIALKLLIAEPADEENIAAATSLWGAVRTVAVADAVMSIDNVLAIAGASHGDWTLIVLGLLISIPVVIGGSTLIVALLARFPILVWGGAALLGWIAGQLIAAEPVLREALAGALGYDLPQRSFEVLSAAAGAVFVVLLGKFLLRNRAVAQDRNVS
jgi:YjbE family integral membrane protein